MISVEGEMIWLEIEILERHRVRRVVEVVEITSVERDVGATNAIAGMRWIVLKLNIFLRIDFIFHGILSFTFWREWQIRI